MESPPATPRTGQELEVEPRWPIALSVSIFIAITTALRIADPVHELGTAGVWILYGLEVVMLVALVAADSAHAGRRTKWSRRAAIALTMTLVAVTLADTVSLIAQLVHGSGVTQSASALLAAGAAVWLANCLVFGILYWQLDGGGPVARARRERPFPSFVFPQQVNPELAPMGWRPRYHDYLALGLTTNTAFSPTDAMPATAWAKLTMALQSFISLIILGLVIARAVNVLA